MDVAAWLRGLGLEQYIPAFVDNDVDEGTLRLLTEADLTAIGVVSVGHKRRLAEAIAALRSAPSEPPAEAAPVDAEHRQLSVLCCDMVGSTALSRRLDPEEYREVIRSFHRNCTRTVAEFDGWVANFIGDCVLVYFGWPRAHEDDPERAVRTGLALVQAVADSGVEVRVGIATGTVVVGDLVREGPAQEQSAVGMTPKLAEVLQGLAAPGQVVIDELTRRLAPTFAVQALPPYALEGGARSMSAYAVGDERAADSRFDARKGHELAPMVGRDQELALLTERWAHAQDGEGTAVLLVGEAGIGKSRLTRALLDACGPQGNWVRWQCSPYHTGSALWPVIQRLGRAAGLQTEDSTEVALDKLQAFVGELERASLYATLLGLNGTQRYGPMQMTPQMLRERTLEVLVEQLFEMTEQRPLLLVVEDVHWIDPTTMELIERCLERIDQTRVLILITSRPDNQPALAAHPCVMRLSLNRLNRSSVEAIAGHLAGGSLKPQTLAKIVAQTDGVPLFVEELTKAVVETGEAAIPASLHGSLMARLDRLPEVKEVAQVAACIGREFDLALLHAVCEKPDAVGPAMAKLVAAELVFQRSDRARPRFTFKHALVQEAAAESLLSKRREAIHARILKVLETERPETTREVLAQHATEAKLEDQAIVLWYEAAKAAQAKSAYMEAVTSIESAIALIHAQATSPDLLTRELDLLLRLGQCRMGLDGLGTRGAWDAFYRANELLKVSPPSQPLRMPVQYGLWNWQHFNAETQDALALSLKALAAEELDGTPESQMIARRMVATSYQYLGEFAKAEALYDKVAPLLDSESCREFATKFSVDPLFATFYQYGLTCCLLGRADDGRRMMERGHSRCGVHTTLFQRAYLHIMSAIRAALERDSAAVSAELAPLGDLLSKHRVMPGYDGFFDILCAWTTAESGFPAKHDIARRLDALGRIEASGQRMFLPFFMAHLALDLSASERRDEAMPMLDRAFALCEETGVGWCDAELWRVRGELLLRARERDESQAAHCFEQALALGRSGGARLWELRAALSLARLYAQQKRPGDASSVLAPVCEWFADAPDSVDLVEARALLDELQHGIVNANRDPFQ